MREGHCHSLTPNKIFQVIARPAGDAVLHFKCRKNLTGNLQGLGQIKNSGSEVLEFLAELDAKCTGASGHIQETSSLGKVNLFGEECPLG